MRLFLLDNYDSFTWNLAHLFISAGAELEISRNDQISVSEVLNEGFDGVILSPGPGRPAVSGILIELVERSLGRVPILGVCLGHQALGEVMGAALGRAPVAMHGKCSTVRHTGMGIFEALPPVIRVCRYHSLALSPNLPPALSVDAWSEDGVVMGISHKEYPAWGVQFHPESFLTEGGEVMANNFLKACSENRKNC